MKKLFASFSIYILSLSAWANETAPATTEEPVAVVAEDPTYTSVARCTNPDSNVPKVVYFSVQDVDQGVPTKGLVSYVNDVDMLLTAVVNVEIKILESFDFIITQEDDDIRLSIPHDADNTPTKMDGRTLICSIHK